MNDMDIRGIQPLIQPTTPTTLSGPIRSTGPGFGELLKQAVESVNHMQHESGRLEDAVARGENANIHQAIIAGEKAGLSFRLMMQVRNKLIEAYQEVLRIQV